MFTHPDSELDTYIHCGVHILTKVQYNFMVQGVE
jgi:hypothetical protein